MPAALKYARVWNQEIHTGEIFGWPTRIWLPSSAWLLPHSLSQVLGFSGIEPTHNGRERRRRLQCKEKRSAVVEQFPFTHRNRDRECRLRQATLLLRELFSLATYQS